MTKRWRFGYWHNWYKALGILGDPAEIDNSEYDNGGDIVVADAKDCEGFSWIPEVEMNEPDDDVFDHLWSSVGSHLLADDC